MAVIVLSVLQGYTAKNYPDPNYPYYSNNYAVESSKMPETLTVLSYNIWFGENIDQALSELKEIESQKELDILLLQEMDEVGVEQIARELQLNYIYFPAAIEPTYDKNFGNAILSRWEIVDSQKLILPHKSLSNRMNRTATRATIQIHGMDILVYSLHTESVFTIPQFREDQYTTVLNDIDPEAKFVIVGGDFNSFTETDVENVEKVYRQAGFIRASEASGYTIIKYGMKVASDHIFTKGFTVEETDTMTEATASDHLPVWVTLAPK
ncbi:MAG TPA: endonuclease/exonuclease/phosphatase family protein [Anaerolineales bacterium]|nr:endonuclease/exonuclease/phosphatase family protein [Anaerolineales bacterium]